MNQKSIEFFKEKVS